ncbi:hypothetical protein GGTG_02076 [Gaeumannomyces tritici R3-111a-1]|uniref:Uncharacterized protein n=1 Tax=Gaeumannomyces tritici (strain R3-111a-1) TaxID=644352 RepID=J3NLC8_GAET3|nr:hypothetical protein GGTG_02076 [Gaeumannomyces tritici R3-111a-1]EJT82102.1 hypothetical protein GGTG_02076 [Gaeumannomyces tritici R3-111a-1]
MAGDCGCSGASNCNCGSNWLRDTERLGGIGRTRMGFIFLTELASFIRGLNNRHTSDARIGCRRGRCVRMALRSQTGRGVGKGAALERYGIRKKHSEAALSCSTWASASSPRDI